LSHLLAKNRFREDLYYRLKTVPIQVPPLRERPEDIAPLVEHFIKKFNTRYGKKVRSVDPKVMRFFKRYHWPGNVRELERFIEHAFVFIKGPVIFERYLPKAEIEPLGASTPESIGPGSDTRDRRTVLWALAQSGGNRQEAAALLGISRTSMWRRMKALNLT
jgi:transcriptional regulator with PAS, ATPase and Fis domain